MGKSKITIIPDSIQLIRMTDEEYFGDKYKDYISNSKLKLIDPNDCGSEESYLSGFQGSYSESFELGSAVHEMLLQPDCFYISSIRKPSGKLGLFADKAFKHIQEGIIIDKVIEISSKEADYYSSSFSEKRKEKALESCLPYWEKRKENQELLKEEIIGSNKEPIYLSEGIFSKFEQCMNGVSENPKFYQLLHPNESESYNEYAILCEILVETDQYKIVLKFKAKLDNYTINFDKSLVTLNDLKTTGKPVNYFMGNNAKLFDENGNEYRKWIDGSFQHYKYYRQMAVYLWLLQCYLMKTHGIVFESCANMLVVETIPEFKSKVYRVSNSQIKKGLKEMKELLILVANLEWKNQK